MGWLHSKIVPEKSQDNNSEDSILLKRMQYIAAAGFAVSLILMLFKAIFRPDISNLLAESATSLFFILGLFFASKGYLQWAINLVFCIPLITWLYYFAETSNQLPPGETIHLTLWWIISGLVMLLYFSPVNFRSFLFFCLGIASLVFHISNTQNAAQYFSLQQVFVENPLVILSLVYVFLSLIRYSFDQRFGKIRDEQSAAEKQIRDIFKQFKQPLAQISAVRDQEGNILRLQVERINHSFESGFKISQEESARQEINYLFNYIFRNDVNWNDLFILNPRQQTEMYSPHHDRWFKLNILCINPVSWLCLFYDFTNEKKEIMALQDTRSRYLALLEAIPDIFFVIDRDGIYEDIVFKGQGNLHYETSEIIGNSIFSVGFSENMSRKIFECIQKAILNDSIETIEYTLEAKGTLLMFEMRIARLNNDSVISIARDITRRKKAEFDLEKAKIRAEEAVALKSRFLANLSHDIRTPMNIIIGLTKLLAEPGLSTFEKEEFIMDISAQGYQLLGMIDDTIHLSKIETNTLDINYSQCNINQLLRELYNHFYPLIPDNRNIQLKMNLDIKNDVVGFETDANLLKEALSRLIDNALKFTTEGIVKFGYLSKSSGFVEFFVEDTGPGIPDEEKENIFLRFYVIEADRAAQKSGPGLGLPIAQHFIALLEGELKIKTVLGKGTRFWFELPLKNSQGFMHIIQ